MESVTFTGSSDIDTQYYIFTGSGGSVVRNALDTTPFTDGRTVNVNTTAEMVAPSSTITSPTAGQSLSGNSFAITGTATANGGSLTKVEVSTNGGQTWANASGTTNWSYNWTLPASGTFQILSRATDSNGNVELPSEGVTVVKQDQTPPVISNITATNVTDNGATINWLTDEGSSGQVSYGLTNAYGTVTPLVPGPLLSHTAQIGGLAPSTTYHYKVTSTDVAGNPANSSDRTFTTTADTGPANTVTTTFHTTSADFALGDLAGTAVTEDTGGEVRLAPGLNELFFGTNIDPATWTPKVWTGGAVTVSGGSARADGGAVGSIAAFTNDVVFEARATLGTESWQQLGLGTDLDGLSGNSRAVFSTANGGQVFARTTVNGIDTFTPLAGLTGSPHLYKIVRTGTQFQYYADGSLVATHNGFSSPLKAWISDYANGGQNVNVDWLRILPFAFLSGTYESPRIDTGAPGVITTIAWNGATPAGTTLTVRTRSSANGTSWSSWSSPVTSGGPITSPSARYLQYQVTFTSNNSATTPELDDVTLTGAPPPVIISNLAVSNISTNSATVSWTTNQPTDGVVSYGLTALYGSTAPDPAGITSSHSVTLSGLAQGTTYHYKVTSTATGGNSAQSSDATFATTVPGTGGALFQTTVAHFTLGTPSGTAITEDSGGEVRLTPALNDLFTGSTINGGLWTPKVWTGGSAVLSGGTAQVDGSAIGSNTAFSGDVVFEARATLGTDSWQQIGLGTDLDGLSGNSRAVFSTSNGGGVYTRTSVNGTDTWTALSGLSNAPHTYRIERSGTQFRYYVDGALVATNNGFSSAVKAWVSDYGNGGQKVIAEWLRVTPFSTLTGTFESAIVDTGAPGAVTTVAWHGVAPAGTSLQVRTRTAPDAATWSPWSSPIASGGTITSPPARYIQYQLTLTSNSSAVSPEIDDVGFGGGTPPVITGPSASNITGTSATISWSTNVTTDGVLNYGTTPAYGLSAADLSGFVTSHAVNLSGLTAGTTYHYQVTSATNGGASAQSADATFTTLVNTISTPQTSAADFLTGTLSGTAISEDSGGEVRLAPALNDIFSGSSLNASLWNVSNWTSGTTSVSGGNVTVNGNGIGSQATVATGAVFEGTATFSAESWQFFGLASDLDGNNGGNRAGFTTGPAGNGIYARTSINNVDTFTAIAGNYLGSSHTYRVEYSSNVVRYYIDGALVVTQNQSVPGPLKAWVSDYANSGNVLTAGWLRVSPYVASGTYQSGTFDGGSGSSFVTIAYGSTAPAGTSVQMRTRTSADGINWSAWSNPVVSGGAITSPALRFLQYQITLTTSDTSQTPVVDSVSLAH